MAKSLSRKRSAPPKDAELAAPMADPSKVMPKDVARAMVASEFIFANARRHAEQWGDSAPSVEGKQFFWQLAQQLAVVEEWMRPIAARSLRELGLPEGHAFRDDLKAFAGHGVDAAAFVQRVVGDALVDQSTPKDGPKFVASDGSTVRLEGDGVIRHTVSDDVLEELGVKSSKRVT